MKITGILTGLLSGAMILTACSGKDPDVETTSPTGATMSGGTDDPTTGDSESTTGSASGTESASGTDGTSDPTTTASGTTTDGGGSDSETEGGCSFIDCNDGGGGGTVECDVWAQDCPEDEKCAPWDAMGGSSWNATKCVPIDPNPVQPGDVCNTGGTGGVSGLDNCDKSSMCWNVDGETDEGTCVAFCEGSEMSPSCAPGFSCAIANMGVLILCLPNCDPLLQDCPGNDLCLPIGDGWICVLDASGGEGVYGAPCEFANACNPGLLCINAEYVEGCQAQGCCTPFCDTTEQNDCPGGTQECIPWYEPGMEIPGYENVGVCGIPQ